MKSSVTEVVFVLDRSGSMSGLENDTIGGFNAMLRKQQAEPGERRITTVLFDHEYELLHDRIDIKAVQPLTERDYYVRGNTALLDAVGTAINKISNVQKSTSEDYRAEKVLFIITTDGMENASREFTYKKIKDLVEQKKSIGWDFIFLGANIDAIDVADRFGIAQDRAKNFHNDSKGIALNFEAVSRAISSFASSDKIGKGWSAAIDKDYKERKNAD